MPDLQREKKTIREQLVNITGAKARASFKGREIAKAATAGEHQRGSLRIEILEVNDIDGGVEAYARAWRNGEQLGFGDNGSVDIERFRFFNPFTLVYDESGDIEIARRDGTKERVREDAHEALLLMLEGAIETVGKTGSKIQEGKVGNTTSTFYSGGGSTPVDGRVSRDGVSENMATIRAGAGTGARTDQADDGMCALEGSGTTYTALRRAIFGFDTSALGDSDTISSAVLSFYGSSKQDQGSQSIVIDRRVPASASALANSDFNIAGWDAVEQANRITIAAFATGSYNDFTLNSTGRGNISKTGNTWFGTRISGDFDNSAASISTFTRAECYFGNDSGTSRDPKLVVEHSSSTPVTVTPSALVASFSLPSRSVLLDRVISVNAQVATFSLPSRTVSLPKTVAVGVQSAMFSIPTYTLDAGGNITVPAGVVTATFSLPTVSVLYDFVVAIANALSATFSTPARTVSGGTGVTVPASVQTGTFSLPSRTIVVEANRIVPVGVVTATFTIPTLAKVGAIWRKVGRATSATWTRVGRNSN